MAMPRFDRPLPPVAFTGDSGAQGSTGAQGIPGTAVNTGATGPTGSTGPPGTAVNTGASGPTGPKGDTGVKGATGEQGLIGDTGPTGAVGANGTFTPTLTAQTGPTGFALSSTVGAEPNMFMTVGNNVLTTGAMTLTNNGGVAYTGPVAFTMTMPPGTIVTSTGLFTVNDNYGTNPIPASTIFIANPRVTANTTNIIISFNAANWQTGANGLILRYSIMFRNV